MNVRRRVWALNGIAVLLAACAGEETAPPPKAPKPVTLAARAAPRPAPTETAKSFRFDGAPKESRRVDQSPLSLTASDGTGLRLVSLDARAVVDDPLAFTELRLAFDNPEDRVIEGQFRITLPPGASLSRFAMLIDGRWQEGEVVELQAARRAYEDALHRRQDPALLEQAAGNEFSARVFPIPARGRKELVVAYAQELPAGSYTLPLRGLPRLGDFSAEIHRRGAAPLRESRQDFVPDRDLVVDGVAGPGLRGGEQAVARVIPVTDSTPEEITSLLVLFDGSASRGLGYAEQVALLERLVSGLAHGAARDVPFAVAAFDQDVELVYEGTPAGWGDAARARLVERGALGASDLARALRWAAERGGRYQRVVIVGDGVATAGASPVEAARALAQRGVARVDAVVVGGIRDEAALRGVVAALPRAGAVIDGRLEAPAIAARLTRSARANVEIAVEGASWWHPRRVAGVQAGDAVLVYAGLPAGQPLRVLVDGKVVDGAAASAPMAAPLLERAAAQARIATLVAQRDGASREELAALRQEITALSLRHRVVSPYTAFLVLETERDYARFGIERRALADILTVRDGAIAVLDRATSAPPVKTASRGAQPGRRDADEGERAPSASTGGDGKGEAKKLALGEGMIAMDKEKDVGGANEDAKQDPAKPMENLAVAAPAPTLAPPPPPPRAEPRREEARPPRTSPYSGPFREVMAAIARKRAADALARARAWRAKDPGDVMALVALGEALEASGDPSTAARAYGSLIDLFPARADLRRFAGQRLERLAQDGARELAVDTYRHAVEQRPDHPASHRLYGFALLRAGAPEAAFEAIARGLAQRYPEGRFAGVRDILAEDLGLVAAAWIKAEPARAKEIRARLRAAGGRAEDAPSLRFVLVWETDANDVDFHIHDAAGNHAFYSQPELASGGRLYADVTTGFGPECFTIRGARRAGPYRLEAHYYSRGPMGYGMGKLEIIEHDGRGGLKFEQRPFVVMQDGAYVDLGKVRR